MPEGHTLHRLATALDDAFTGHPVRVTSPQGRFEESAALLDGQVVAGAESWGKHLWLHVGPIDLVHVHLGLYGRFDVHREVAAVPPPVGQVRLRLVRADGAETTSYADLRGATACELQTAEQRAAIVDRLGPDPLRPDADGDAAYARVRRSRAPIAGLLMDQSVVAGIGNVYRAELLFRHRLDPFRPGTSIRPGRWGELWADLVALLHDGVRDGRDPHRPPRGPHRAGSATAAAGVVRLPQGRRALPDLRHAGPHPGAPGPQPLLVCEVSAPVPLARRTVTPTTTTGRRR